MGGNPPWDISPLLRCCSCANRSAVCFFRSFDQNSGEGGDEIDKNDLVRDKHVIEVQQGSRSLLLVQLILILLVIVVEIDYYSSFPC